MRDARAFVESADYDVTKMARPEAVIHSLEAALAERDGANWLNASTSPGMPGIFPQIVTPSPQETVSVLMTHPDSQTRQLASVGIVLEAGIDFSEGPLREAEVCARKVAALDPRSGSGLQRRGWIHYSNGRIQQAVRDLKAAHQIDRNNPDTLALLANCYLISGTVSFARPLIDRLLAVDPLTPLTRCMPGFADLMEGNFPAAIGPYRQMFEMDPGNPMARLFYVPILAINGRSSEMMEIVETFPPQVQDTIPARLTYFLAHALAGNRSAALAVLTPEIEAIASATDVFPRFLAQGYAVAGMPERAIHWLSIAVDRGFINYPFLAHHDPFLKALGTDSRFRQLLATVRERWEQFEP